LSEGLRANGSDVSVVRVADGSSSSDARVIGELVNGSATSVAATSELLNASDIVVVQHEYGIYGGVDGDEVVDIIGGLRIPSIVVAHTVLKDPTPHQRSVLEAIAAMAAQVVVSRRRPVNACVSASTSIPGKSPRSGMARPSRGGSPRRRGRTGRRC